MGKTIRQEPLKQRSPVGRPGVRFTDQAKQSNKDAARQALDETCGWCYEELDDCFCEEETTCEGYGDYYPDENGSEVPMSLHSYGANG